MADMRKAFLADIIENIDDDTPRLVFADWLEDNGDEARAEFIRLQCRLAAEVGWPRSWRTWDKGASLTPREAALIAEHGAEWMKEAPKWVTRSFAYYRGFVGHVCATRPVWLKGVGRLYLHVPVEGLEVLNMDDTFLTTLTSRAECRYLRQLQFPAYGCSSAVLAHFFASADLRRLVTLDYKLGSAVDDLGPLLASNRLSRLRCLILTGGKLNHAGAASLAASGLLRALKSLVLNYTDITGAGASELAKSPGVSALEELTLFASKVGGEGLIALAASPYLGNLRRLHIGHDSLPDEAVVALASSPHLTKLEDLFLQRVSQSPTLKGVIAESQNLIHLRRLHLNNDRECADILDRLAERRRERGIP